MTLPITGEPEQVISPGVEVRHIAVLGPDDYIGMRPRMAVQEGDTVKRGQLLFDDKRTPGVRHTAPGAGTVVAVHRGERRKLLSVMIELNERERQGQPLEDDQVAFESFTGEPIIRLTDEGIQALLLESGLWSALRTRPFSKVADPAAKPHSIFVTAMDTNPLAASPEVVAAGQEEALEAGLMCLVKLGGVPVHLCRYHNSSIATNPNSGVLIEEFKGPHPAGTVGVHIHFVDSVRREKTVWHINYQDVIAMGQLFRTGRLDVTRVISLGGPSVLRPRLLRTRLGACTDELVHGELKAGEHRVISGSVLSGRAAMGEELGYLGRYHQQVSVLPEGRERPFLGWLRPGSDKFSVSRAFFSCLLPHKRFDLTTAANGSRRAIVPIGNYERVMPMDLEPTFLLRALAAGDLERAEELGCLELDEEDLALCTFVCPGKNDYGPMLRHCLTEIEKEG